MRNPRSQEICDHQRKTLPNLSSHAVARTVGPELGDSLALRQPVIPVQGAFVTAPVPLEFIHSTSLRAPAKIHPSISVCYRPLKQSPVQKHGGVFLARFWD